MERMFKQSVVCLLSFFLLASGAFAGFEVFRDRSWVSGEGRVARLLEDDLEPPCHQRFIIADENGRTLLVVNNIDGWPRLAGVSIGNRVSFQGEFIANGEGGLVHWTHPDPKGFRPGGFVKLVEGDVSDKSAAASREIRPPSVRKEYFAGRGPMSERKAAPVNDDWPETGYWLSTNSGARHNRKCENYRKTRGYPCDKKEGRPCGKCGG